MITKREIEAELKRLDKLYAKGMEDSDPFLPVYCCKLAVLDLAGWVEESFDDIAWRAIKKCNLTPPYRDMANSKITGNYGFCYKEHFRKMMVPLIGMSKFEKLHVYLDQNGSLAVLDNELKNLKVRRNDAAHLPLSTFSRTTYTAPNIVLAQLTTIHPIIKDIFSWFCHH